MKKVKKVGTQKPTILASKLGSSLQVGGSNDKLRLNTHLWHVKRFKVSLQDGWYTPIKHISRGLKSVDGLYDRCVVQDVSYHLAHASSTEYGSIHVSGGITEINALFGQFTDPRESLIYVDDEDITLSDAFEKEVVFHARQRFPAECIGPVMLLVTPGIDVKSTIQVNHLCTWYTGLSYFIHIFLFLVGASELSSVHCCLRISVPP